MTNFNLSALALNPQNMITPMVSGGTLGFTLGTGPTTVLPGSPQVQKIIFHNPGTVNVFVCQALDANGNALVPGPTGGSWEIFPGGSWIFTGNGAGGVWLAAAASAGGALTVATSQTP